MTEDIEPECLDALLPGLIIQPLLENAIKHGVSKADRSGIIQIRATRVDDRLEVSISDNGPGLTNGTNGANGTNDANSTNGSPRSGLGLANTRERLQALYGHDQELRLEPHNGGGLVATVSVPFHTTADLITAGVEE